MWPILFTITLFGLNWPLHTFGLFVAAGFFIGIWFGTRLSFRYGSQPGEDYKKIPDLALWLLLGVIGGGRLAYVLVNLGSYTEEPLKIFAVWEGGLVMYGGLILAALLGLWKVRQYGFHPWQTADYGLTAGFLGQGIGRWGCLAVGDDYGAPTNLPWAIRVPDPLPEGSLFAPELVGLMVHPTQLYMSLKGFLLFGLGMWLLRRKRKFKGQIFCILMAGYAVLRSLIEFVRYDTVARGGIWKPGKSPDDVTQKLQDLGIGDASGSVIDPQLYQTYIDQGMDGLHPELLISSSQLISLIVLPLIAWLYVYLSKKPANAFSQEEEDRYFGKIAPAKPQPRGQEPKPA